MSDYFWPSFLSALLAHCILNEFNYTTTKHKNSPEEEVVRTQGGAWLFLPFIFSDTHQLRCLSFAYILWLVVLFYLLHVNSFFIQRFGYSVPM